MWSLAYVIQGDTEKEARQQIVDGLKMLSDAGLEGVVLSWPNYRTGMKQFRDEVLPLLKQAGLR